MFDGGRRGILFEILEIFFKGTPGWGPLLDIFLYSHSLCPSSTILLTVHKAFQLSCGLFFPTFTTHMILMSKAHHEY